MNDITSSPDTGVRPGTERVAASDRRSDIGAAIAGAAERSQVDFDYLLAQAQVESSLNPGAKARSSSATGLYQFIESTWLSTVKKHGPRFGLREVASQIGITRRGGTYVADPAQRQSILALRNDPQIASYMAAGLAEDNRARLLPVLGREPDHSELYMAHFLGAGGASRFLSALQSNPDQTAASIFPRAAATNQPVFYERGGGARSLQGVMDYVRGRMERALDAVPGGMREQLPIAPHMVADEGAFSPMNPPAITMANRVVGQSSRPASLQARSLPTVATSPARQSHASMSQVLQSAFGAGAGNAGAQIKRAYEQFKVFGL